MILPHPLGSAPSYEIRNLLLKTFPLIYYGLDEYVSDFIF
jgi:hypothetical protein